MWSRRVERINELLLHEISRFVTERQDPDIGFVTFTEVKVTEDLMSARVYYSVLGSEEDKQRTAEALFRLRHEMVQSMRRLESLRRIPVMEFVYDQTPEKAARVYEIIEKIHQEQKEAATTESSSPAAAQEPAEAPESVALPANKKTASKRRSVSAPIQRTKSPKKKNAKKTEKTRSKKTR